MLRPVPVLFGVPLQSPGMALDDSWQQALVEATDRGWIFGRDLVFTYGPLGFVMSNTFSGLLFWSLITGQVTLAIISGTVIFLQGRRLEGGSTITQQVAELLLRRQGQAPARRFGAKLREAVIALRLEHRLSKDEILALYLSLAPYGNQITGAASRRCPTGWRMDCPRMGSRNSSASMPARRNDSWICTSNASAA